uniref:Uncharacterized protein n=1 Tax=Rhizophagus irregularis (strain DAOM 181602 / DAOM 197198 / MUCL 43194) TaxID=747089 RepID=U9UF93_RHIID
MLDPTITCGLVLNERRPHFTSISEVKYPLMRYIAGNPSMLPSSFFHSLSWSAKADVRSRWRFTVINQLVKLLKPNQLKQCNKLLTIDEHIVPMGSLGSSICCRCCDFIMLVNILVGLEYIP